jgi:hypothetical protein
MEWILVGGRRWWLLVGLLLTVILSSAIGILYANGVSHLDRAERRRFVQTQQELPRAYGPLFYKIPDSR